MARPKKEGLQYFPLDVDMDQDDKVALIEAKHGLTGFSIIVKLFMKIYKNGYFYEWTAKEQLLFSSRINMELSTIEEVIEDCISWGVFNRDLLERYEILTSKGIQERYAEATARRKEVVYIDEYLLVKPEQHIGNSRIRIRLMNLDKEIVSEDLNPKNGDKTPMPEQPKKEKPAPNVFDLLINNRIIKPENINEVMRDDIDDVMETFGFEDPLEMIQEAIKDSARGNGRTWKFVYNKLNDWRKKGYKNPREIGSTAGQGSSIDAIEQFAKKHGQQIGGGGHGV
ncbi:DUF4373 domain-containing protein [Fictibacillus fluitans]|uniref:DUF4373 domain-containing protein n=1 Tax=Fictibacillus fluitans TaxID=3058422 RepID=A0ABT8HX48_9BACL|nr:DUF4373 domain-containing protein [Fictibacillus sp. NE201]MDN4525352.1 DUF4373 domain-containing protein [Fictibacillus sp. NE201]